MKIPSALTVYARSLPDGSVAIFDAPDGASLFATFPSFAANKPTRRNRTTTINCTRWNLKWLPNQ